MVARSESMFSYDSYSYRLWSLANVWNTCQPPLTNGSLKEVEDLNTTPEYFIKCPQCQKGCQSFQALKEHMELAHTELTASSETSMSVTSAVSPTPLGGPGGPYGCAQCSASFTSKEQLEKHELLHSPNAQVACKTCNKTFANVYRLQRHMISHDESAVLRKFKCTECDKAFKFKHHLKEHIRIHSGEKPFECGNCGKRFSHSGSYSSHMTSKKCLVMNLKQGRNRTLLSSNLLDKNAPQSLKGPKRSSANSINNNITTSPNHNSPFMPILPKYPDAAALFQSQLASNASVSPYYLTPHNLLNPGHTMNAYMPAIGHLLEQFQQRNANALSNTLMDTTESKMCEESCKQEETISTIKRESHQRPEDFDEMSKSNASECGDLVMDEDADNQSTELSKAEEKFSEKPEFQLLKKEEPNSGHDERTSVVKDCEQSHNNAGNEVLQEQSLKEEDCKTCVHCNKIFNSTTLLEEHDCKDTQSEGLAAKLEAALTPKSDNCSNENMSGTEDHDFERSSYHTNDEMDSENYTTTDHVNEDGRKVRVRSLISEDQLKILKDHYKTNPRPKREDLEKIAGSIGFPVRVVQVWFQNTRARDRREGRLIQVPYSPIASGSRYSVPSTPLTYPVVPNEDISEQPLDLSVKREANSNETSPSSSPKRPHSVSHSESHDEVVNLSHKSSRSPTPYLPYHNNFHGSNSSDPSQSPSPLEFNSNRLAQIFNQPPHKLATLPGMGLVPMDHLMHFGPHDLPLSLTQFINSRISSLSPNSTHSLHDSAQEDDMIQSKRLKIPPFMLKNMNSPALSQETEVEGQFQCDQCDKAFSKQSSLARHKYEHSGQRPHKCDECPKAFKHKHHLTEHKRLHSGEKPFQCGKCLKRFSHSGSYSQHMNHRYSYCKPYRE